MSKKLALLQMATMFAIAGNSPYIGASRSEQKKERKQLTEDEIAESRGLKKFYFGENYVWAINKKNADRKARKAGFLNCRQTPVIGCFCLEHEEPNPFVKPSNKNGNNGYGTYQSGRRPSRWKGVKFIENVTEEYAIKLWQGFINEEGWRIVNWDNGEIVAGGKTRF